MQAVLVPAVPAGQRVGILLVVVRVANFAQELWARPPTARHAGRRASHGASGYGARARGGAQWIYYGKWTRGNSHPRSRLSAIEPAPNRRAVVAAAEETVRESEVRSDSSIAACSCRSASDSVRGSSVKLCPPPPSSVSVITWAAARAARPCCSGSDNVSGQRDGGGEH